MQERVGSSVWLFKVHEWKMAVRETIKQLAYHHSPDHWGMSPKERGQVTSSDLPVLVSMLLLVNIHLLARESLLSAGCPWFRMAIVNKHIIYGLMSHDSLANVTYGK